MIEIRIWRFLPFFPNFFRHFSKAVSLKLIFMFNLSDFDKVQNFTFFNQFSTSRLTFDTLHFKIHFVYFFLVSYFILEMHAGLLLDKIKIWFGRLKFIRNFWPQMTFGDLLTTFYRKLTPRASFWSKIYLSSKFDLLLRFFTFDDLAPFFFWKVYSTAEIRLKQGL